MTATADFVWGYDFTAGNDLKADSYNLAMTQLESYVNALKARLDLLDGAVVPSNYATTTALNNHINAVSPHGRMLAMRSGAPELSGTAMGLPGSKMYLDTVAATIGGPGYVDVSWSTFANGIMHIGVTALSTTPSPVSIASYTLAGVRVYGTAGVNIRLLIVGW